MVPISLGDDLVMEVIDGTGIELSCSDPSLSSGPENLVHRAITIFQKRYNWNQGMKVRIEKRIPIGAGLGGGSSNASATLLGLRELCELSISDSELVGLAGELGSDTAFFVHARPAICRGRGEIIEPTGLSDSYSGILINPGFGVSTPWAYQAYARNPSKGEEGCQFGFGKLRNDLEPSVLEKYPWIAVAKQWLREQAGVQDALMSGSGSSVFSILEEKTDAVELALRFKREFGQMILAYPIRINPES